MKQYTRADQDRPKEKRLPRFTAYLPLKEGFSIQDQMKEELISIRHSPPTQQKHAVLYIQIQEVVCPKCE